MTNRKQEPSWKIDYYLQTVRAGHDYIVQCFPQSVLDMLNDDMT